MNNQVMKKEFASIEEAEAFITPMINDEKLAIDFYEKPEKNGYVVQWIERKVYTSFDGEVFPDEVWLTKDGDLINIQDLSEDHAKNIIRMMIRQERNARAMIEQIKKNILAEYVQSSDNIEDDENSVASPTRILH